MSFQRATKYQLKLRMAIIGPAGSGKTYTALEIATGITGGGKIALLDTEHRSAEKYADLFAFDVDYLTDFAPMNYVLKIQEAADAGYDCLIIDSLSHAWSGTGGALQMVDDAARRSKSANSYFAWRDVTPEHNRMIDAILRADLHIIATMRSKTEYITESVGGKVIPRKIGLAPIQRDGMEYEFDLVGDMDTDHNYIVGKTRCNALDGKAYAKPDKGGDLVKHLRAWLDSGEAAPPQPEAIDAEEEDRKIAAAVITGEIVEQQKLLGWTDKEVSTFADTTLGHAVKGSTLAEKQRFLEAIRMQANMSEDKRKEHQAKSEEDFEQTTTPESARENAPKRQSKKD